MSQFLFDVSDDQPPQRNSDSSTPRVVKIDMRKTRGWSSEPTDCIRVDRGTKWGNPFISGDGPLSDGTRGEVCDLFEKYAEWRLTIQPDWLDELRGKNLGCHCAPLRCHAETLLRLANRPV